MLTPTPLQAAGLDLGSSAVKAVLFDFAEGMPRVVQRWHRDLELQRPAAGRVEQDCGAVLEAARQALEWMDPAWAWGCSSAMHSLVCLNDRGQPQGPAITWADQRSAPEAARLRKQDPDLARRTGTPLHAMGWPAKLLWLAENEPEKLARTERFVDLKTFVLGRLAGRDLPMDLSSASGTGLLNQHTGRWDAAVLELLGLSEERFPQLGSPTTPLELPDRPFGVLGAADGPLSNLGSGLLPGRTAALSVGTSGAVRVTVRGPVDTDGRLFCYHLAGDLWVLGGAISNGTLALQWLRDLAVSAGAPACSVENLVAQGLEASEGSRGLLALPYLAGERAPHWDAAARGMLVGLGLHHRWSDLVRAVLEGIAFALHEVLELCQDASQPIERVRATGGLTRSRGWVQLLADVLGRSVELLPFEEAGALGAALLALSGTVGFEQVQQLTALVTPVSVVAPDLDRSAGYQDLYRRYLQLYPMWRRLCP